MIQVHRRTGGLEITQTPLSSMAIVHRRTGGLEIVRIQVVLRLIVHRRTGGLEIDIRMKQITH